MKAFKIASFMVGGWVSTITSMQAMKQSLRGQTLRNSTRQAWLVPSQIQNLIGLRGLLSDLMLEKAAQISTSGAHSLSTGTRASFTLSVVKGWAHLIQHPVHMCPKHCLSLDSYALELSVDNMGFYNLRKP